MKKILKKAAVLLTLAAMLMSTAITAFAQGSVTYDGQAQKFIFAPGSQYSPTDLFDDFKNMMPGDSISQPITVKNDSSNNVKVKIYMRSLGASEESVEFLSQLHLTVAKADDDPDAYMFDAAANETAGLTDWVLLGTLYSGGEVDLTVTLEVPIELDNDYQKTIGYVNWEFKVEEFPVEESDPDPIPDDGEEPATTPTTTPDQTGSTGTTTPDQTGSTGTTTPDQTGTTTTTKPTGTNSSPKTGDTAYLALYCGLLGVSLGLVILLVVLAAKKKKN